MLKFNSYSKFYRLCLCTTLCVFTLASLPISLNAQNFDATIISDAAFGIRVKNIVDRLKELEHSNNVNKMIAIVYELKQEIENYSGVSISISNQLDQVREKLKASGYDISSDYFNAYKKLLKKKKHKSLCEMEYMSLVLKEFDHKF